MSKSSEDLATRIEKTVRSHEDDLIELRRHFHSHPELSRKEFATTETLRERLEEIGFEVHVRDEGNGLYADLESEDFNPEVHPTVAIRSDIDALPIEEENDVPYKSQKSGVMHACGHDVHMSTVTGAGLGLEAAREEFTGRVRLIYQHAEEVIPGGAHEMVDFGALDGVDAVLGLHCDPSLEIGKIGVREGSFTAAFDEFHITIIGKGGHGARPHNCVDPIYVATQLSNAFYQAGGRTFDARDPVVISIGSIEGGDKPNVIPEEVTLSGTVRTLSEEHREKVEPMLKRLLNGVCSTHEARYELDLRRGSPAIYNDSDVIGTVENIGREFLGDEGIHEIALPSMGSEDFSVYLQYVPGAMFRLGTAGIGPNHLLHSSQFDVDERAIALGSRILARSAADLMEKIEQKSAREESNETIERMRHV